MSIFYVRDPEQVTWFAPETTRHEGCQAAILELTNHIQYNKGIHFKIFLLALSTKSVPLYKILVKIVGH